jgi:nitrous oxidase accessory protein NosD
MLTLAVGIILYGGIVQAQPTGIDPPLCMREAIHISSDDGFIPENGIVSGDGSVETPYLIEGWIIDVEGVTGIRVQGTSAHFAIRGCKLVGEGRRGIGIVLGESTSAQATVEDSTFQGLRTGIFVYRSAGAVINANSFEDCSRGIEGSEANGVVLRANAFSTMRESAIFLWRCHEVQLEANRCLEGGNGVYLDSCHRAHLAGNCIMSMERGVFLWDCFDCTVVANEIRNCDLGLGLVHTSAGNAVFHNSFVGNDRQATCDGPENRWDDGYPSGGNYWSEGSPVDVHNGFSQIQSGSDGIADKAREIPFNAIDRYPLVAPRAAAPCEEQRKGDP